MENTTQLFLGVRFNCNKCHDHPFERWTQDQYYQTAAYFAQVGLQADPASEDRMIGGTAVEGAKPLFEIVSDTGKGEVIHDRTKKVSRAQVSVFVRVRQARRRPGAAAGAGCMAHVEGQPVFRQELCEPALGLPVRRRDHRAARRHPRRQPGHQPRASRLADQGVHQQRLRRAARDAD